HQGPRAAPLPFTSSAFSTPPPLNAFSFTDPSASRPATSGSTGVVYSTASTRRSTPAETGLPLRRRARVGFDSWARRPRSDHDRARSANSGPSRYSFIAQAISARWGRHDAESRRSIPATLGRAAPLSRPDYPSPSSPRRSSEDASRTTRSPAGSSSNHP